MLSLMVLSMVLRSKSSDRRVMRSVSLRASSIHGVALSSTVFNSSLRSSMEESISEEPSPTLHSFRASAIAGLSRNRPEATAAENMARAASGAVDDSF